MAGIRTRHGRSCRSREGGRCNCSPSYEAWVYSKRDGKKIRKTFATTAEARSWRSDSESAVRRRTLRAPSKVTVSVAAAEWLAGAQEGKIRNRSGHAYKPSAIRGYEAALRLRVLPEFGGERVSNISRVDLQELVERLQAKGLDASTIQTTLMPLRAIYKRPVARGQVAVNPTTGLSLPAVRGSGTGSRRRRKRPLSSPPFPRTTGRCGRPPSTAASDAVSSWRCAGKMST